MKKNMDNSSMKLVRLNSDHNSTLNSCNITPNQPLEKEFSHHASKTTVSFGRVRDSDFKQDRRQYSNNFDSNDEKFKAIRRSETSSQEEFSFCDTSLRKRSRLTSFDLTGSGHNEPQSQITCSEKKIELVGTLVDYMEKSGSKKASPHSNPAISGKDVRITMSTTQELIE